MPKAPFEWIVATRFLREGRMQTALILGGTAIGVAVILFITALINSLQASLATRTLNTQAHVVVRPPDDEASRVIGPGDAGTAARIEARAQRLRSIDQWEAVFRRLESTGRVTAVSAAVSGSGTALRGNANRAIALFGIEPDRYARIVKIPDQIVAGEFRVSPGNAVIGVELARDLGASVGDRIRVITPEGGNDVFLITGLFDLGVKDVNKRWVLVPLKTAQALLALPGGVTNIDLTVDDIFAAEEIARRIERGTGLKAESWMAINTQLLAAFNNQTMTTRVIRAFVVLIVALGIASVLVVSVVQKQKEIGILRAMGTSPQRIMRVFLIQGALVGSAGAVFGSAVAATMVAVAKVYLRAEDGSPLITGGIEPYMLAGGAVVALATGVLAAVAPARRAAKLDPVQAIRG
jgi:lipoprotein-releasing system permease protein